MLAIPLVAVAWSRLVLTWFLAPAHLVLVGVGWAVLAAVVAATRSWWVATAVGGAVTLRALLLLAVLAVRGPGGYWFVFWTEPGLAHCVRRRVVRALRLGARLSGLVAGRLAAGAAGPPPSRWPSSG